MSARSVKRPSHRGHGQAVVVSGFSQTSVAPAAAIRSALRSDAAENRILRMATDPSARRTGLAFEGRGAGEGRETEDRFRA